MKLFYKVIKNLAKGFFKLFYNLKVFGLEHYIEGAGILAGNHTSFYDPPLLSITWPEEVHFLARASLFRIPILGFIIKKLNTHPVTGKEGDVGVFKTICQLLLDKKKIILFPEGRRADKDELQPLKPGIVLFLSKTNCPVIPAYIHNAFSVWNRFRKFPKFFKTISVVYGTPIYWESFAHLGKKEGQAALLAELAHSIERLKGWYEAGAKGVPP